MHQARDTEEISKARQAESLNNIARVDLHGQFIVGAHVSTALSLFTFEIAAIVSFIQTTIKKKRHII